MNPAEDWPATAQEGLRDLADWLDEADRLVDALAKSRGMERRNSGDEMQQALRGLAAWFEVHPDEAADAWAYAIGGVR